MINGTTRRIRLGIATVSVLFCITATAGPALGQEFGSCHIAGDSGSKVPKAEKKKGKGKHKGGSGGKRR